MNRMADCFTLRKRITRLKCVNSEVSSSSFTLKRVPSNGSMAPCWNNRGDHARQELDHLSDLSGTESRKTLKKPDYIISYYIILYYIIFYHIISYYIILYFIILYYIVLYCIIFYFISIMLYYIISKLN